MRYIVEARTDAATLVLFDPGALPADFERLVQEKPVEVWEELSKTGKGYCINTGADGGYLLHAYVDEPIQSLEAYIDEPIIMESFSIPTGQIYFAGAEYGFRDDDSFLRNHPHMGGSFNVRAGVYRISLWRTEYPEGLAEQRLREQVSALSFYLHQGMGWFAWLAVLGVLGLALTAWFVHLNECFWYLLPLWSVMVLAPLIVSRLWLYKQAREQFRIIERDYPSVVAQLEFLRQS